MYAIAAATAAAGALAAVHYFRLGLTLAHYDARAHLVVARRILDSLTPGWQQIGAVWLPMPHVLNMVPVQVDAWYRNGASAVAISVLAMALASGSLGSIILRTSGSAVAAWTGALLLMANPNVVYLQSTPMTEPLLFGLTLLSIAVTTAWIDRVLPPEVGSHTGDPQRRRAFLPPECESHTGDPQRPRVFLPPEGESHTGDPQRPRVFLPPEGGSHSGNHQRPRVWLRVWLPPSGGSTLLPGIALSCACLTRYEAWPITAVLLGIALAVLLRRGVPARRAVTDVLHLALWPLLTILVFSANSRWVIGAWFVSGDFFVPENVEALGHPSAAWQQMREGLAVLAGPWLLRSGYVGTALLLWTFFRSPRRAPVALLIALFAAAAVPVAAYVQGHPFRIRYDVPLVIASAAVSAAGIGVLWRVLRLPAAVILVVLVGRHAWPIDHQAPLVLESQREAANMAGRRAITAYLLDHYDGRTIMMSMGSLGHYMHDLSLAGFDIKDFLHEGNGEIWRFAMLQPRGHAAWLIIEGSAEGGDALYHASLRPRWLDGFEKVAEGGGATLYHTVR